MEQRDSRYDLIKLRLLEGKIQSFLDIFLFIPKSVVAADLGKNIGRFTELMNRIEKFTLEEFLLIGGYCKLTVSETIKLVEVEYLKKHSNSPMSNSTSEIP